MWAWSKCKRCNERVGAEIESGVVRDDSIQLSVLALKDELPDLAKKFEERVQWFAATDQGQVRARVRDGEFEVLPTSEDDGSRLQSREAAREGLRKRLARAEASAQEVDAALQAFDAAEVGVPFEIAGETLTHGVVGGFSYPFVGQPISDAFPSLIAFHALCLALGKNAYDDRLDTLRRAILNGDSKSEWHAAESGIDRTTGYKPFHLVGIAQNEPHVVVRVQLFGWNVWRVHFPKIASKAKPEGIYFDLPNRTWRPAAPAPGGATLHLPGDSGPLR